MDNALERLEQLTQSVISRLDEVGFEDLAEFVEQRERLIHEIQQSEIGPEMYVFREKVQMLLEQDSAILNKMERLKEEARQGMNQMHAAKKRRSAYDGKYIADSVFFDKKK